MAKRKRGRIRSFLEYVAIRWIAVGLNALPDRAAFELGTLLGRTLHFCDVRHRRITENNLRLAFGASRSEEWVRATAREVYEHFGHSLAEIIRFRQKLRPETVARYYSFEGVDRLRRAQSRGKGTIIVTGHIGNWESAGVAIAAAICPITTVVRPLDNPLLNEYLVSSRRTTGQRIVPKRGALRILVEVLREGGTVIVVGDQHAGEDGIVVDFFGQPASTISSVASLAVRFGSAIVPGYSRRLAPFKHVVFFDEPIVPDPAAPKQEQIRDLTARFTKRLECFIRECPDQWLWLHRRWRAAWPKPTSEKLYAESTSDR